MADETKFAQFIASKKLDPRRILVASHKLETLTLEDRTIIIGDGSGTLTINAGDTLQIADGSNTYGATLDGVLVYDDGSIQISGETKIDRAQFDLGWNKFGMMGSMATAAADVVFVRAPR